MITRNSLGLVALLLVSAALAGAGCGAPCTPAAPVSTLDTVMARKQLIVGVKTDAPPFGFVAGGNYQGYDIDLARQIAHKLGVKVRFVPVTSADRIQKLNDKEVDLIAASMTITREREKDVDFSLCYFSTQDAFLVKSDSKISGYLDLAKMKVGVIKGSTGVANLAIVQPEAEPVVFDTYTEAFAALKAGHIEALTSDLVLLAGLAQGQTGQFKIVGTFGYEPYGLAMRQNDSKFRGQINDILQELWDQGVITQNIENWFGDRGRFPLQVNFTMETFPIGK
ncbi:MAG: transporter substrate-binding domain-containing protein [Planctomycetota bacterium]